MYVYVTCLRCVVVFASLFICLFETLFLKEYVLQLICKIKLGRHTLKSLFTVVSLASNS